ncbi:hypothetical protein SCLCIDRAFT_774135 [Scleroderma citrinum Foug A]|uniref:Uncharacterized protein n=1 Tax=Scleroderma citrinum Foug A TaxID=1036808 RepID=A0A0C3ADL9_9AGAM|nr:hypothetical protein SCLCIDRAFT_774135 [Scleroderma citrinum Foug A]
MAVFMHKQKADVVSVQVESHLIYLVPQLVNSVLLKNRALAILRKVLAYPDLFDVDCPDNLEENPWKTHARRSARFTWSCRLP